MLQQSKPVRSILGCILAVFYLLALSASVVMIVKPGAAIFFYKQIIPNPSVTQEEGYANRARIEVNPLFLRTKGILLFEDGIALTPGTGKDIIHTGGGIYATSKPVQKSVYLYFSASDNSEPATNGKTYIAYLPIRLVSRSSGIIYLLLLSIGIGWFLVFALAHSERRRMVFSSPTGIFNAWVRFIEIIGEELKLPACPVKQRIRMLLVFWKRLFTITLLMSYFYVLMEWIFFITMPSFMSLLSFPDKVEVLFLSGFTLALTSSGVILLLLVLDFTFSLTIRSRLVRYAGVLLPTLLLSALVLLLVDNFTYTIFKFGISTTAGVWRAVYGLVFIFLMVFTYTRMVKSSGIKVNGAHNEKDTNRLLYACAGLLIISAVVAGIGLDTTENQASIADTGDVQAENRPNILLIGSDGLNADAMSVYGSRWDTTPTLRALAETFLVAENAFSNSANTAGSVVSVMTSKLPTQTRVLYPPDILTGLNAYQHLPGILKSKGYRTVEFGSSYYVDAYSLNIQYGFDMVNNRSQSESKPGNLGRELGFENTVYFANKLVERITARLLHIFYLGAMPNPYRTITKPIPSIEDNEKVNQLLDIVDDSEVPVFIHAHLLGTHGGYFSPKNRVFSAGVAQTKEWMPEYYADAILAFDRNIGRIIDHLQASGEYQNTILIIYTDHNERYRTKQRVPLIIHFPGDEYAGRIATPSQNLDIAPTILDYLGITQPDWMSGNSLLSGGAETNRLIFSAGTLELKQNEQDIFMLDPARNKPPFYQFSWINIIDCQKWYAFNLATLTWTFGQVANYVKPCDHLLSLDEIKLALKERLTLDGFDTSNLP